MDSTIVTYQEAISVIADLFASGMRAVLVDGPPGCGKNDLTGYVQEALKFKHRFITKPGHHENVDYSGCPVPDHATKRTHFYPTGTLLPESNLMGGLLNVLDEIGDAPVPIQNLACQWVFENGQHGYQFPPNTKHMLLTNRVADRSGANRIVTKLGNRVAWLTLMPTVDELFAYGASKGWNPAALAFLKLRGGDPINPNDRAKDGRVIPTYFNSFDPSDPAQSIKPIFSSSRSWEFTSNLLNYLDQVNPGISDSALLTRVASLVGTPVASALVPFRSEAQHMPNPMDILMGKKVPFPKHQSVLWTLTISLVSRVEKAQWKHMDTWLKQGPAEFRILAIKLAFDTKAAKLIGPDFNATLQEPDVRQAISPTA